MAVSNLTNGVDWYSLSDLTFLSTTKLPGGAVFYPSSAPTYSEDGNSVILGSANGSGYILHRYKGIKNLEHGGTNLHLRVGCSDLKPRRLHDRVIGGVWNLQPPCIFH
jgi:hypothetical protein